MFNYLYKKYKVEILKTSTWLSVKELKLYEKIFLGTVILGGILSGVFTLIKCNIGSYIALGMIIIGLVVILVFRSRKKEQQRIVKEIIEPSANDRMKKMVQLLTEFGIDISNEEQLNNLIEQAKKEQADYDVWKDVKKTFSKMTTYIILPIITIFLSEYFKDVGGRKLIVRATVLLMICICIVLVISAFSLNFNDIFNSDIRNLNYFIRDTEDVKIFTVKANEFASETRKEL